MRNLFTLVADIPVCFRLLRAPSVHFRKSLVFVWSCFLSVSRIRILASCLYGALVPAICPYLIVLMLFCFWLPCGALVMLKVVHKRGKVLGHQAFTVHKKGGPRGPLSWKVFFEGRGWSPRTGHPLVGCSNVGPCRTLSTLGQGSTVWTDVSVKSLTQLLQHCLLHARSQQETP